LTNGRGEQLHPGNGVDASFEINARANHRRGHGGTLAELLNQTAEDKNEEINRQAKTPKSGEYDY
jgi:hypothetical protein